MQECFSEVYIGQFRVIILSHQGSVIDQLPEVAKERCLKMLHDKSSFVLIVSIVFKTTYMTTETEEIA